MPLTVEERVRRATAGRVVNARIRRFQRFAEEMGEHPADLCGRTLAVMADLLRSRGWSVTPPQP